MSWLSSPDAILSSGWLSSAYAGHGILGADIPTTGDSGGSPVLNDGISPTSEYRWGIETPPASGSLLVFEDLTLEYSNSTNGVYSFVYRLWEDGVDQGTATVTLQVGPMLIVISATTGQVVGDIATRPDSSCTINALTGEVVGNIISTSGVSNTLVAAVTGAVIGAIQSRPIPTTEINATLGQTVGNIQSYPSGVSITTISATTGSMIASIVSVGPLPVGGSLSDADIARIVAAVTPAIIAALNATTIPVDVQKINSVQITGAGVEGDPMRPA